MMDLTLSQEQQLLVATIRDMCRSGSDGATVRRTEISGDAFPAELWKTMASAGMLGLSLSEKFGGAGAGLIESCLVAQELGRCAAPLTPIISCVLVGGMLSRGGSPADQHKWLPQIAAGEALLSVAWLEEGGGYDASGISLAVDPRNGRQRIRGSKVLVPYADQADAFVVPVRLRARSDVIDLYLLPAGRGISSRRQGNLAGESLHQLAIDIDLCDASRLGAAGEGWQILQDSMTEAAIVFAAYACGGARRVLELATAYAKSREQFGRPIGANQAIAFPLADMLVAVEGATTLMFEAAWSRDVGRDYIVLAAMAKQRCCEVYREVTAIAHQVYGGIGYTLDVDVQLYSRRAKQLQMTWWDDRYLSDLLSSLILDEGGPGLPGSMIER